MRGIFIDPFTRSITEVDTSGKLAEIYELLGVELITIVSIGDDQALFLDDEGLLVPKKDQEYWQWWGSNQPYAGRGLILGIYDEGENADATSTLEEIESLVRFLDKEKINPEEFIGFTVYTW